MARLPPTANPPYSLAVASLALGSVGMLLFFLPILGMPLCGCGLALGIVGLIVALAGGPSSLRLSVLGIVLCLLAGTINVAIALAPGGRIQQRVAPRMWLAPSERPYVPPPAPPEFL